MRAVLRVAVPMAVLALAACGAPKQTGNTPPGDEVAPEFEGGGQQGDIGESLYPGPYGVGVGSVIPNYQFYGYPNSTVDKSTLVKVQMADFYNPTGDGVYPEGSPYGAGTPKPKAIVLDRAAVWCPPCNYEAHSVLPDLFTKYSPGGTFLLTLVDGAEHNVPASQDELTDWTTRHYVEYPGVLDPHDNVASIVGVDAYPGNVIVRTRDMKIVTQISGAPEPTTSQGKAFWDLFQKTIDGQPVLEGDQ